MAWIPIHDTLFDHPRLLRAADALGIAPVVLAGHLAALWSWVRKYGQGGMLRGDEIGAREIAQGARWPRNGYVPARATTDDEFVEVLIAQHWLHHIETDEGGHAIVVPNWAMYAGKYEQACIDNVARNKAWRASQKGTKVQRSRNRHETVARRTGKLSRDELEEKREEEKREKKPTPLPPKGEWPGFDEFWAAYPARCVRRVPAEARKAWDKHRPDLAEVLAALKWQDKDRADWQHTDDAGKYVFIKAPAVWINQHEWTIEPAAKPTPPAKPQRSPLLPPGWEEGDHVRYPDRYPPDSPQWKASYAETHRRIQERWRARGEGFARA